MADGDFPILSSWVSRARGRGVHAPTGLVLGTVGTSPMVLDWLFDVVASGGNVTAPVVSASWAWQAQASVPVFGVVAPTVAASYAWSATSSAPIINVVAPVVSASYAWSANPGSMVQGVPEVSASWSWSATASQPVIGVNAPAVAASWAWQANGVAPSYGVIAPVVVASWAWLASPQAPDVGVADVVAPVVTAAWAWLANSSAPSSGNSGAASGGWGSLEHPLRRQANIANARALAAESADQARAAQARDFVSGLKADVAAADLQIAALRQQYETMRAASDADEKVRRDAKRAARGAQAAAMDLQGQLAEIRAQVAAEAAMQAQIEAAAFIQRAAAIQLEEIDIAYVACVLAEA